MSFETVGRIAVRLFDYLPTLTNDWRLDDARIHSLAQRRIAYDVRKNNTLIILRCRRKIQLRDNTVSAALAQRFVDRPDCLVPGRARIPDMMRFVIEDQNSPVRRNAVPQLFASIEHLRFGDGRPSPCEGLCSLPAPFARIEEPMNVCQVKDTAGTNAASFVLQDNGKIPVTFPFGRDKRVSDENVRPAAFRPEIFP